jgi:peptide/nickel transport system permease protein
MTDDNRNATTDGGIDQRESTFETVNWDDIDSSKTVRSTKGLLWSGIVAVWVLGVLFDVYSRHVANTGAAEFPIVGPVAPINWLWSMTLFVLVYYGIVPLVQNRRMTLYYWKEFRKNKAAVISGLFLIVVFVVGIVGRRVLPRPTQDSAIASQPPAWMEVPGFVTGVDCVGGFTGSGANQVCQGSWQHPLGTTNSGEDILVSSIYGMEVSMQVGLISTLMSIAIAAAVGMTAAYKGGLVDEIMMRYVDIQITFPSFFLFLLLAYTFQGSLFLLILIFGLFGWGSSARIIRAEALQRVEEPYIQAAKSAGASTLWTLRRHVLPNVSNTIITAATLTIPGIILAEAAFAFIGLGDPTVYSWGQLIADGRNNLRRAWWISTFPGVFLFMTILAFNFLGDALRDALDPRHGGSGE